jgi:hypothetical protein
MVAIIVLTWLFSVTAEQAALIVPMKVVAGIQPFT